MSGKRFRSRAKTVQKLGRDGLMEQNMATGEAIYISIWQLKSRETLAIQRKHLKNKSLCAILTID